MTTRLVDIPQIAHSLKVANTKAITLLNTIVFNTPHDRSTRNRLREFSGFPTDYNLTEKVTTIKQTFSLTDLIQVANLLNIEISTDPSILCDSIFQALTNITDLKEKISLASVNSDIEEMPDTQVSAFPTPPLNTAQNSVIPPHSSPVQIQVPQDILIRIIQFLALAA